MWWALHATLLPRRCEWSCCPDERETLNQIGPFCGSEKANVWVGDRNEKHSAAHVQLFSVKL